MQQQNTQLQTTNQKTEPIYAVIQANTPPTFASLAQNRIMNKLGMTEQEWAVYDAEVSIGLLTLRTAFPTQSRNYSDREFDMLTALWLEVFVEIERGILNEAVIRFVTADRKGFFPAPGQIMSIAEEITAERKKQAEVESTKRHYAYLRELQKRINNGENCSTCKFCEHREVISIWDKKKKTGLFCQKPESYKFEGEYGYGTAASILCEYYINLDNITHVI